ncbi:MAG: hypothetical protein ABR559_00615 [Gemmatimonadota bacterium]
MPTSSSPLARVAIGGRMQVGKTTAADYLVRRYGYVKYALADPIKTIAREGFGWDGAKDEAGRRLLQEIGTVGRAYRTAIWLEQLATRLGDDAAELVVVDDVRLDLEADWLAGEGFHVVVLERPPTLIGALPANAARHAHETESELARISGATRIVNDGTFNALYARLDEVIGGAAVPAEPKGPA